jgi:hypothetical protein
MTNKTTIKISLSRLHKIADRLKERSTELFRESIEKAHPAQISGFTGEAQVARFVAQGNDAMELSDKAERYARLGAEVRAAIGRENESRGINGMLAKLDGVKRLAAHKKELLEHAKSDAIAPAELASYKPISGAESRYGSALSVATLSPEHLATIEKSLSSLQREAFALSDQIAEANAPRMEIELDADIASEVTGG